MAAPASVGLDIGSVSVRAVQVVRGKDRPLIENFGQVALPDGAMTGGMVTDERAVAAAVRELWSKFHLKTKTVQLGVAHQQVVVREVELANLPAKEMKMALPHQARELLPLPVDQAILDFFPLDQPSKSDTVRGLLVAAPRDAVTKLVHAVERGGVLVERVDLSCFALLRAVAAGSGNVEVVADVGASGTTLVIHIGGVPQIVRTIPRGGDEVTRMISERLHLGTADAEQLKCGGPQAAVGANIDETDLAEVIADARRPLVREISSSIAYFANGHDNAEVDRLVLTGGGAGLTGLGDDLARATQLPVEFADPFRKGAVPQHRGRRHDIPHFASLAAISVGLGLGIAS